ncbi:hypothetical protein [Escherichia coli]
MTASPEWWKEATPRQQAEFFARSEQWLERNSKQSQKSP